MQDEPALVDATRKFIRGFSHLPDPVVAVALRAKSKTAQVAISNTLMKLTVTKRIAR